MFPEHEFAEAKALPASVAAALAPATRLTRLELRLKWSDDVAVLSRGLAALEELR